MLRRRFYIGLGILLAGMTPAAATNHFVRMDEVMVGAFGDPDIQFVEMTFDACGQNVWGPDGGFESRARLAFFDENDIETGEFLFPSDPPCSANNKVLIATQAFADLANAPTPDFIMTPSINPGSGKVCFRNNPDSPFAFFVTLCLSYGDFTGDSEQGSAGNAPAQPSGCSLRKEDGGSFGEMNQFNDDFQPHTPDPENNFGSIGIGTFSECSAVFEIHIGDVGIGTAAPEASLHVRRSDGSAQVRVEETNGTAADRKLFELRNNGPTSFTLRNTNLSNNWNFTAGALNNFQISKIGSGALEMSLASGGDMEIAGTLTQNSDRDSKENFTPTIGSEILEKVAELPIATWNLKANSDSVRHLGPMAQDFRALFGLGRDERHIAPMDAAGVALAAIQGLYERVKEKEAEIESLQQRLDQMDSLRAEVAQLKVLIAKK